MRRTRSGLYMPPAATPAYITATAADSPLWQPRLDELAGTLMADGSGNGRDGSYVGGPTLGQASLITGGVASVAFDGTTNYGEVANAAFMNSLTSLTLEAIIKTTSASANGNIITRAIAGTPYRLGIASGKLYGAIRTTAGETVCVGTTTINTGSPIHVAMTWNGSTIVVYVAGTSDGTTAKSGSLNATTAALRIATRASLNDQPFIGTVDMPALYGVTSGTSGALTGTRIAAHAAAV